MDISRLRSRSVGALAALAAAAALAPIQASTAAPLRTATTTDYSTAQYLQRALNLPASTADTIEPVTYDRFQWLLGHADGNLAVLIGDPAQDATFKARAQDTATAAKAASVKKVYWFNPNLSGGVTVGGVAQPNLDIRDAGSITSVAAGSRTKYKQAWQAVVGQHLGNGWRITVNSPDLSSQTVSVVADPTVVNDYGQNATHSTKVGNPSGGALYDYTGGSDPANAQHSHFFVYNRTKKDASDNPKKIVAWTDLTTQASSTSAQADVTTAINSVGGANLVEVGQFAWWKSAANAKQVAQSPGLHQGAEVPVVTDADNADGWRINQVTYPQLVDLLEHGANDANAVILLGGTWCPNTRAVLPQLNQDAQQNDVTVYNFDTVLDGAQVGGSATSAANPLQTRNTQHSGSGGSRVDYANPSFLYGAVLDTYLKNIKTEYAPTGNSNVTYYPGGDSSQPLATTRKLQVPFVLGYQKAASGDGVTRQWIIDKGNDSYTEYMTTWWLANPKPSQLGFSATDLPAAAPIWNTINEQLRTVRWNTDPTTLHPDTTIETDDAQFLVDGDTATVTYNAGGSGSIGFSVGGSVDSSPAALSAALAALGIAAPENLAAAKTALIAAERATPRDATLVGHLRTLNGAWGIAQRRKGLVISKWGNTTTPGSVLGGLAAVNALDVFFGGLPGGVLSRRTITANPVTAGESARVTVTIENDHGRTPTGPVSLVVTKGGSTVATTSAAVSDGTASFDLGRLAEGTYDLAASYAGDDQIVAFAEHGQLTVTAIPSSEPGPGGSTPNGPVGTTTVPVPNAPSLPNAPTLGKVGAIKGLVVKAPTRRKGGTYKVSVRVSKGAAVARGKVTIKLKKGAITKTLSGKLSRGAATVKLPKLAKGTWSVSITYPGDARYAKRTVSGPKVKVTR